MSTTINVLETSQLVSPKIAEAIALAAFAAAHPLAGMSKQERDKHHRKAIRSIAFHHGLEGVAGYKKIHPDAASIRVNIDALAYSPKPEGYDAFLMSLVERWLTNATALNATNTADVKYMNTRLGSAFNPAKHFSEPLSLGRRKKLKRLFAQHNAPLDVGRATTMSKIRGAAKSATGRMNADRPFANIGVISGDKLIVHAESFLIELNGHRECIRVTMNGRRLRLYLDELEWIANWLIKDEIDLLLTTTGSIGELAYSHKAGEIGPSSGMEISELAYKPSGLTERLAALKQSFPDRTRAATIEDKGDDPLNL